MRLYYPEHNRLNSFSLPDGTDVIMHPGEVVEIPDEYAELDYVKRLQALGILVPPPEEEPPVEEVAAPVPTAQVPKKIAAKTSEVTE